MASSTANESESGPHVYFGTMTFAWAQSSSPVDDQVATEMLRRFRAAGGTRIDTARIYAEGNTEPMLGRALKNIRSDIKEDERCVGTKVHPSQTGGMGAQGMQSQLSTSLEALELPSVKELYLHQPDTEHSLEESLATAHKMVQEGLVGTIGMSNYHASEVQRCIELCQANGWTMPSVYQGIYSPLNRLVESDLLPLLKKHNISFVAYNPLAGGMLTGKYLQASAGDDAASGRFKNNQNYIPRFYTEANFKAVKAIHDACEECGITMVEAAYRWLLTGSALGSNDGLLIGASSLTQLDENLKCTLGPSSNQPLPDKVQAAMDGAWSITKDGAFPYWRSYSSDHPNRESLDPGAAYSVKK